jgi:hypothetical protein
MKSTTVLLRGATIIALLTLSQSCASSPARLSKPLEQRTLWIDEVTLDRFKFCGDVCVKRWIGVCVKKDYICDYYEFADKAKIKTLLDTNMVLKKLEAP